MKNSIQEKIELLEKQIRLCSVSSIIAIILTALLFLGQFCTARFGQAAEWKGSVLKVLMYIQFVMPFVIILPLFIRVNLKGKLYQLKKEEHKDSEK